MVGPPFNTPQDSPPVAAPAVAPEPNYTAILNAALAEFGKLRDEISGRSTSLWTLLGLSATVSSAVAGFVLAQKADPLLLLLLPLLTPSLGLLVIDHGTNIGNIGQYINTVIRPLVREATGEPRLLCYEEWVDNWEKRPIRRTIAFGLPLVLLFTVVPLYSLGYTMSTIGHVVVVGTVGHRRALDAVPGRDVGGVPRAAVAARRSNRPVNGELLLRMGLDALDRLASEHGVDASDAESGLYPALYGRDSLWVVLLLQHAATLRPDPRVESLLDVLGPRILTSLAALQGTVVDDAVEEQPGRIPHEYHRVASPHAEAMGLPLAEGRSYGGFDETFLFVLAHDAFVASHPAHQVAATLQPSVASALAWIDGFADPDGDGLYEYSRRNPANLLNQVWKDSFDVATHTGFDVPPQPLAWLEVQSYAYAVLAPREPVRAARLVELVDERFWLSDNDGYAVALDGQKAPIKMVGSNGGHALWAGAVRPERVEPLVRRMTQPDLLSDYGLRSLSRASSFYAPFAYHRGAVWPFDNAVFALGLLRNGHDELARARRDCGRAGDRRRRHACGVLCGARAGRRHRPGRRATAAVLAPLAGSQPRASVHRRGVDRLRDAAGLALMRVLQLHWAFPPTTGGVESHVADLSVGLASRRLRGDGPHGRAGTRGPARGHRAAHGPPRA